MGHVPTLVTRVVRGASRLRVRDFPVVLPCPNFSSAPGGAPPCVAPPNSAPNSAENELPPLPRVPPGGEKLGKGSMQGIGVRGRPLNALAPQPWEDVGT